MHILKDGVLKTAPCDNLILPGITRAHRIAQCKEMGIPVVEEPFTLDELMAADEVFFTSASALCCRVTDVIEMGTHDMFLADIVTVSVEESLLDESGNLITEDAYLGKTIDVRGIVDYFDGDYQIKVFSRNDIIVH